MDGHQVPVEAVVHHAAGSIDMVMNETGLDVVIWPMAVVFAAMFVAVRVGRHFRVAREVFRG